MVHAKEDARAGVPDAVDADLLTHREPPPSTEVLCVPGQPPALKRGARLHLSVVGAVSDVVAANAGRLGAAAREALADAIRPAADAGDPIDVPAWTRALAALETAAPDGSAGLDGNAVDLRILLFCAFRHDMGGDGAGLWTRLLDDPPEEIDGQWRAISARDLYEAGYAPQGAPKPSIQHLEPYERHDDPAWGGVYLKLVGGTE